MRFHTHVNDIHVYEYKHVNKHVNNKHVNDKHVYDIHRPNEYFSK